MKNLTFKSRLLVLLGVITMCVTQVWGAEGDVFYTMTTPNAAGNIAYANYYDVTIDGIQWNAPGNQSFSGYWRIGGKQISSQARTITGKGTIDKIIGKVRLNHKGKSNNSLTVNSIALTIASDAAFNTVIETITKSPPSISTSTEGYIDFEPTSADWPSGCYYKLTITVTNTTKSNYGLDVASLVFYEGASTPSCTTPTFSQEGGSYCGTQSVTISCSTDGASIYYTTDGTTPTSSSTLYSSAISVSADMTIKAIAVKDGLIDSEVATATYSITDLRTADAIFAAATDAGVDKENAADVCITFTDWVITGINNNNYYVTDGAGKGAIIFGSSLGFAVGDKLNGTVSCSVYLYRGAADIIDLSSTTPGLTVTHDGVISPQEVSITSLSGVNTGAPIIVRNVTYDGTDLVDAGDNKIKPFNGIYPGMSFTTDSKYDVTGVYLQYGDLEEILPRSVEDIEEKVKTVVSIAVTTAPKTSYTTCENLVLGDWVVTATYDDDSQENVTLGCTFSPADDAVLTVDNHQVTVTHTASGKQATQTITVDAGSRDKFIDNLHENDTQYGDCDNYTVPSLSDETPASACEGEHYHFVGWSSAQLYTGQHATEPAGLLKAGSHHSADGTTYYAVWAKEQH